MIQDEIVLGPVMRPVKINSMFYLRSREHFAENPGKKTQAKFFGGLCCSFARAHSFSEKC